MRKLLFSLLIVVIVFSGCTTSSSQYTNDVITQNNLVITNTQPYTDSSTSIHFDLLNTGTNTVPRTIVDFYNPSGLQITNLICQGGQQVSDEMCEFDNIATFDSRFVSVTFATPSANEVQGSSDFTIFYNISFDYSGFSRLIVPIIDPSQETQAHNKYSISEPSVGPIALKFEPPIGGTLQQGNQQVTEYWGTKGESFQVKMDFSQAVQTSVPTIISASNIVLNPSGVNIDFNSGCDFNSGLTSNSDITVGQGQTSLSCNFIAKPFNSAETTASIDVSYAYTFSTINSATITVNPRSTTTTSIAGGNSNGGSNPSGSGSGIV